MIAALYVDPKGCYAGLDGVDLWDEKRDARLYTGPYPVVAHPPCNLWVNMAAVNWKRYGRQRPAWYPGGDDGGCFAYAFDAVRRWGGVLEHPASSHAWSRWNLPRPVFGRWIRCSSGWVTEVWQSAYGHPARKKTWLLLSKQPNPPDLIWEKIPGTHQIGWFDRNKPTLGKRAASATPAAFRDILIAMARSVVQPPKHVAGESAGSDSQDPDPHPGSNIPKP